MQNYRPLRIAFLAFGLALIGLLSAFGVAVASAQTAEKSTAPPHAASIPAAGSNDIAALLAQLKKILAAVKGQIDAKQLPTLKSVQLNLQTGIKREADGSLGIFIFTVGASASDQTVQMLNITLTPPTVPATVEATVPDFNRELAQAIIGAAESVATALKSDPEPKLVLQSLEASINFTYENVIQGGIDTAKLLPITVDLAGKVTPTAAQRAVLTFEKVGS
jgi:hypothetical protein